MDEDELDQLKCLIKNGCKYGKDMEVIFLDASRLFNISTSNSTIETVREYFKLGSNKDPALFGLVDIKTYEQIHHILKYYFIYRYAIYDNLPAKPSNYATTIMHSRYTLIFDVMDSRKDVIYLLVIDLFHGKTRKLTFLMPETLTTPFITRIQFVKPNGILISKMIPNKMTDFYLFHIDLDLCLTKFIGKQAIKLYDSYEIIPDELDNRHFVVVDTLNSSSNPTLQKVLNFNISECDSKFIKQNNEIEFIKQDNEIEFIKQDKEMEFNVKAKNMCYRLVGKKLRGLVENKEEKCVKYCELDLNQQNNNVSLGKELFKFDHYDDKKCPSLSHRGRWAKEICYVYFSDSQILAFDVETQKGYTVDLKLTTLKNVAWYSSNDKSVGISSEKYEFVVPFRSPENLLYITWFNIRREKMFFGSKIYKNALKVLPICLRPFQNVEQMFEEI